MAYKVNFIMYATCIVRRKRLRVSIKPRGAIYTYNNNTQRRATVVRFCMINRTAAGSLAQNHCIKTLPYPIIIVH